MTAKVSSQLFFTPHEYFSGLIDDIYRAQRQIRMETYIFNQDETGESVLNALENAIARGVSLQLLIDGVGSYRDAGIIAERLRSPISEVRVFHPLPWDFSLYRRALYAGRWYSRLFYLVASINHRDHRKLCLIDAQIAWLGSYNITSDHANPESRDADDYWHDTGLRVTGSVVSSLAANFNRVWHRKIDSISARSRRFLASEAIAQRRQSRLQLMKVLENARQCIYVTNAYFNPSNQILKMLKRKAGEGISVKLIVPARSDIFFFPWLSRSFYVDLLQANIRVFEYGHRVLHSKTMIIDDCVLIGSTNLNYRSLFHDLELDLLSADAGIVARMERRFADDIQASSEISLRDRQQHPWLLRLLGLLSRFLRYWL
ncbi:MAG: phosphatidylserine/phosphatidylglycerophosphate/cardiolipin synthase family protein [Gammaproteobacteria bacterium]|nr:phosphatidylserine/phosphatidylglycerophosphate/cardiolipin synthase family protein [Gammaproteobacteria bacterium]